MDKIDGKLTDENNDLLHVKDHLIKKLLEENTVLRKKVSKMEIDMQRNFQEQRENNLEISGIPFGISDVALENVLINTP